MKKTFLLSCLLILAATRNSAESSAPPPAAIESAETTEASVPAPEAVEVPVARGVLDRFVVDRLEVGVRTTSRNFDETRKGDRETRVGTYFGTINQIVIEDDSAPNKLFLQYRFIQPYVALGLGFDHYEIITRDGPLAVNTDGTAEVDSVQIHLLLRYPLPHGFVPFFELGRSLNDVTFQPLESWAARGNSLDLTVEDATFYSVGLEYHITRSLSVHALYRWMSYGLSGEYNNRDGRPPLPVTINADQTVTGFGLKYTF